MEEIELVKKRKKREKHFLQKDGSIKAEVYSNDVHFYKNGEYLEIDNTLVKKNDYYRNLANDYKVYFKDSNGSYLMKLRRGNNYVSMKFDNANFVDVEKDDSTSNLEKKVFYKNILDGIDLEYMVMPTKVKETIILRDKKKIRDKVRFIVRSNLKLILKDNYIILESKNKERFTMEVPYMIDSNGIKNENVRYQLRRRLYYYELDLIFDRGWLEDESRVYPVYIDPTITNSEQKDNVYDTYIYNRGPVYNPNHLDSLKAGVDRQDGIDITYRTLLKFNLPNLGTSDEIIEAHLNLVSYPEFTSSRFPKLVEIHRLTKDFDEELATWDDMYDKYDQRIEGLYYCYRSRIDPTIEIGKEILVPGAVLINGRITDLVKKWYTGTPNYGIMLKASNEVYEDDNYPMFFSKSNSIEGSNPKPVLVITYRNQNGLEGYLDYKSQSLSNGTVYQNTFNGNLTAVFNIGSTIGGRFPTSISLVYNTNDVILNKETTYGKGNKLSLDQTVKKAFIDGVNYLEYVDEDGTLHYFYEENDGDVSTYHDEDGLDLVVKQEDNSYIMLDKTGGVMKFVIKSGVGYLSEIVDVSNNKIEIVRNSNNYVTKVIDGNNQEIILSYNGSVIEVVSPDSTVKLNYQNSKLIKLETRDGSTLFTYNQNGLISKITDVTGRSFGYTYYSEKPYKVMSVFEYGLNNVEGASFTLKYGFNTTSIVDYKGRVTTLVYNSNGNVISSNSMEKNDDIRSAYSVVKQYGEEDNKNKLLSNMIPVRYVKNYLKNTSFEKDDMYFSGSGVTLSFDTDNKVSGYRSLKIQSNSSGKYVDWVVDVRILRKYTFSGYFKSDKDFRISLRFTSVFDNKEREVIEEVLKSDNFVRSDISLDSRVIGSNVVIRIYLDDGTTLYMDDIQLEEGEVANNYNMLENSDFSDGILDWTFDGEVLDKGNDDSQVTVDTSKIFEVVNIDGSGNQALRVKMDPKNRTSFKRDLNVSGKKGDLYHLSFWYKNEGIEPDDMFVGNSATLFFKPVNYEDSLMCVMPGASFPPNQGVWQYFSYKFIAEFDYDSVTLMFNQGRNANDFYITNLCLYKDLASNFYDYDVNGNVIGIKDVNKKTSAFNYDGNNQLIGATTPRGKNFRFEYDNVKTDKVLSSISSMGICNKVEYDDNGNPIRTRVSFKNKDVSMDNVYRIKESNNKYLRVVDNELLFDADNSIDGYTFKIRSEANGRVKIVSSRNEEYVLKKRANGLVELVLEYEDNFDYDMEKYLEVSNYLFVRNKNGSFHVVFDKSREELINGENTGYDYLKVVDGKLGYGQFVEGDSSFEFYFELDEVTSDNTLYKIRSKGTNKYLSSYGKVLKVKEDSCSNTLWKIKWEVDGKTKIIYDLLSDYFFTCINGNACLSKNDKDNLLVLEKQENGSYYIRTRVSQDDLTDEVIADFKESEEDIDFNNSNFLKEAKYLRVVDEGVEFGTLVPGDSSFEFYFEIKEGEFIETSATYTDDGRFVSSVTDSNFNKILYDTDSVTGLLKGTTNAKGIVTSYMYNDKRQIISVTGGEKCVVYSYNSNNLLDKIIQGTKEYRLTYDEFLNAKEVRIGDNIILSSNEYEEKNGNLVKTTYGNNQSVEFSYDEFDRVIKTTKMDDVYSYKYDNNNDIVKMLSNDHVYKYSYDIGKRLSEYRYDNFKINYEYDSNDNVIEKKYKLNGRVNKVENTLNKDDLLVKMKLDGEELDYTYDSLGRLVKRNILNVLVTEYDYVRNGRRTSELVRSIKNGNDKYSYRYDELNNITEVYYNDELVNKYSYDEYNELVEEIDYRRGINLQYVYDNCGNLLTRCMTDLENSAIIKTDSYLYENSEWEDQLTGFNGKGITYDAIGNPLTIGSDIELTWINGRSLKTYSDTSKSLNVSYKYNNDGIRYEKTVNGSTTKYYLEGTSIVYEKKGTRTIYYLYDATGVIGLRYDNNTYLFEKSLQGDTIGIVDSSNKRVATYEYDAWGKVLSIKDQNGDEISNQNHVGIINPFRYRGYYYDTETGLYYLNSRYYNPEWCRFINEDETIGEIGGNYLGHNMYQYSFNNPINLLDSEGSWPKWAKKIAAAVAIVTVVVLTAVVVTSTAGVGTVPAVIACGAAKGAATGLVAGATYGAVSGAVSSRVKNGNWNDSKEAALNGMGNGALAGTIGGTVSGTVSSSVKVYNAASSWSAGGTYSSGYNSMVNHYERQVLNKGFSDGNNVINYTNDALNFANRNSEVLQFINPSRGTMTSAFRSPYMDGVQGGWFTSDGKILTFWYK